MVHRMALEYVANGWQVVPLHSVRNGICGCGKPKCKSPGKHPRLPNGLHGSSCDPKQVLDWFGDDKTTTGLFPGANIGIRTGNCSRLVVVDVDGLDAQKAFEAFQAARGALPATARVLTGRVDINGNRTGYHYYFGLEDGQDAPPNSQGVIGPGIDVRGEGGYVVAPPSLHWTGRLYRWDAPEEDLLRG